ncbi:target snare coiled-coil domain-containing protein [Stachybotrys elegans]|uniref:Target snare coiled-coil domain-containing protein n=1 Tax=Stachybotrys elegans TaxID=80388 RepID=A0A8K0SPA3_9HYPO|nr:target snare coiled-coil domain-containing protein [Stachybotrys elegans]
MSNNPNQLFLLADHVKLSLLERQRAQSLNLDSDTQDGHISRSLDQFRDGLVNLRQERDRLEQAGDESAASAISESLPSLQKQFDDLTAQFHGFSNPSTRDTLTHPNSEELTEDFAHASTTSATSARKSKTVRFSDTPPSPSQELFGPYRDDPANDTAGYADEAAGMSNQQLHQYHNQILQQQDEQLDRLGESIGRQRELSMQIGDELDDHVAMLDEVDGYVDRHQSRLDRASKMLGKVARGASENKSMTIIIILIIILVLLIAILK